MSKCMVIDLKWLPEVAPRFYRQADSSKLSKAKKRVKIEPLFNKFEPPGAWGGAPPRPRFAAPLLVCTRARFLTHAHPHVHTHTHTHTRALFPTDMWRLSKREFA
jgi:hypothetical protein